MAGGTRDPGRSVTSRVLAVLSTFDDSHARLGLTEIAGRSGLPVSTVSRLLAELVAGEALVRRPDRRYEVGQRLWQLGVLAPVNAELREVALPFLHDIQAAIGDVVQIAVREGITALYVERVAGRDSVAVVSRMGSRLPLHATGVGKVLLAEAPPEVQAEALANLVQVTPHTITDPVRLRRDLAETRRRGYARAVEEITPGLLSIAVPIRPHPGPPAAALGIVTSATRPRTSQLVPVLQVAAAAIGRSLRRTSGWPG